MVQRLLDYIEDDEKRRDYEQTIQEELEDYPNITVLTNTYHEEDEGNYILQLSTYDDGDLYGAEIVLPKTKEEDDFPAVQIQDIMRTMREELEKD